MTTSALVIWLHGLGDSGPANASIPSVFRSSPPALKWRFPTAPSRPVTCNYGATMTSWFDLPEIPITATSPNVEQEVLKAVSSVHDMIDKEVKEGVDPSKIFLCGFSQGGALSLISSMLYPKTLGGVAIFSGWCPLNANTFLSMTSKNATQKPPVVWSHGNADQVVEFEAGQAACRLLEKAGIPHEFKAYRGLGHSINAEELSELEKWLQSRLG